MHSTLPCHLQSGLLDTNIEVAWIFGHSTFFFHIDVVLQPAVQTDWRYLIYILTMSKCVPPYVNR